MYNLCLDLLLYNLIKSPLGPYLNPMQCHERVSCELEPKSERLITTTPQQSAFI